MIQPVTRSTGLLFYQDYLRTHMSFPRSLGQAVNGCDPHAAWDDYKAKLEMEPRG